MNKKSLRQIIRERKATVSAEQHRQWSDAISQTLLYHPRLIEAQTILLFYPLPDEPDIRPVIKAFHEQGKCILLPEVTGPETMDIRVYDGEESLILGALGTQHPSGQHYHDIENITVAVIPGVAFDEEGNRMGRGKGYYDRFLSNIKNTYLIGICFPFQQVEKVPTDENDVRMHEVVFT